MPKLSLIQRLTNEMFKLNKKAKRDPRTKDEYLVRIRLHKIENIIRKRYGEIYYLTTKNIGGTVVDEKGDVWSLEMDGSDRETSKWNTDEYGDRSFMWEYR